jgi:hypothetical protein
MYATIEADIENGFVRTLDASRLPAHAHVLITLLSSPTGNAAAKHKEAVGRVPHPDLKHSIEVCGDLMDTVPSAGWNLQQ